MSEIVLRLNDKQEGAFYIMEGSSILGEMVIKIAGNHLTVFHTEVRPEAEGKGYAKQLLDRMAEHAATNHLKVIPLCPYVLAQFKRHPELYAGIWNKEEENEIKHDH